MYTFALDYETYYDKDCSIKTLGPLGYFSHPEFDAYRVSVWGDEGTKFVGHPKDFDWDKLKGHRVLSHNASFDETLYLYGAKQSWWPLVDYAEWHCTADLSVYCSLPRSLKGATTVLFDLEISKSTRDNMSGKTWESMSEDFQREVDEYALKDSELCLKLWEELSPSWPKHERAISALNRKIVQRGIPIDYDLLQKNKDVIEHKLFDAKNSIPWAKELPILSRNAFNVECRKVGIEPPASMALTSEEANEFIKEYGEKYPFIVAVRDFRRINALKKKLQSFEYATLDDLRYYGGCFYFGAHTGRYSGSGGNLNLQNLPRAEHFGVNLRHMIRAPKGKKLIIADLSQIEVRTLFYLAKAKEMLERISNCNDIYEVFAYRLGMYQPNTSYHPTYRKNFKEFDGGKLRHIVKQIILGCGYGVSAKKFAQITGMSEKEAARGVRLYRLNFRHVVKLWNNYQRQVVVANYNQKDFFIELPSGRKLKYGKVKKNVGDNRTNYVVYQYKGGKQVPMRAWGGLLTENASQALSRDIFSDMMLRLEDRGIKTIFHVHDEFIIEVDEEKAEDTLKEVLEIMSTPPTWIPDIPLEAEGKIVNKYQK